MPPGGEFAWAAFWRLHSDRPMMVTGYGIPMGGTVIQPRPGRIPFAAVDRYAKRFGVRGEAFDMFLSLVDAIDREYIAWETERFKQQTAKAAASVNK
jgi:hypothetical protein